MKKLIYLLSMLLGCSIASCDDFLDEEPESSLTTELVFSNLENAEAAVVGCYNKMTSELAYYPRDFTLAVEASGLVLRHVSNDLQIEQFNTHTVTPNNGLIADIWASIYESIQPANNVLAYVPGIDGDAIEKDRMLAEAHFLRALHYFNLVRMFGAVPLYTEPITSPEEDEKIYLPASPVADVYALIRSDLEAAEAMIPADFSQAGRANIHMIRALLAKVHLYLGNYEMAAAKAGEVMAGPFTLSEDFLAIFNNYGESETLMELQLSPTSGYNALKLMTLPTPAISPYDGNGINPVYRVNDGSGYEYPAYSLYEDGDLRKSTTFYRTQEGTEQEDLWLIKYTSPLNYDGISIMRFPEVLLIFAEAEARNREAVTQEAFDAYNQVRIRAQVPDEIGNYPTVEAFVRQVVEEKRRELLLENETWFDYVRVGRAAELGATDPADHTYPVPLSETDQNPNL